MFSATLLALSLVAAAWQAPEAGTVPSATLRASGADPVAFVMQLVEAGVPAGLEIRASDRHAADGSRATWHQNRVPRERMAFDDVVPVARLLNAFNAGRSDYRAALVDGVVIVRPVNGRAAYLDGAAPFTDIAATGFVGALDRVFAPLDPSLVAGGGRVGSTISPPGVTVDRGASLSLRATSDGKLVIDVLHDLARQAAGHAWLITTDADGTIVQIGAVHRHGTTTEHAIAR